MREEYEINVVGWVVGAIVVMLGIILLFTLFTTIPAGNVGIKDTFGSVGDEVFQPGLHMKNPFTSVQKMNIQTLQLSETTDTPSKEGLVVSSDITVLYHLEPTSAVKMYKEVGMDFGKVVVEPQIRSTMREITAKYEVKELYTNGRAIIENDIYNTIKPVFEKRGIILESILLRGLTLPEKVKNSIEDKLKAEQDNLKYDFLIQQATKEAERKVAEAKGIADSQKIIDGTLSEAYLQYLWIKSIEENKNVMYVPIGSNGLQLYTNVNESKTIPLSIAK
jgi:regulator of protease activity HflC (stomatin/prohibitin superfamily)